MGQSADQPAIELFRNSRRQRFASGEVLLNARRQRRTGAPVAAIIADNPEHACVVDAGTIPPVTAPGLIAFVSMVLGIVRVALDFPLPGSAKAVTEPQTNARHVTAAINELDLDMSRSFMAGIFL
jgi:hypothetical protein